jgi:hypothetical protein
MNLATVIMLLDFYFFEYDLLEDVSKCHTVKSFRLRLINLKILKHPYTKLKKRHYY